MNEQIAIEDLELGYDVPATVRMDNSEIQTPCLVLDLDTLERSIVKMSNFVKQMGVRYRLHCKMYKSVNVPLKALWSLLMLEMIHSTNSSGDTLQIPLNRRPR